MKKRKGVLISGCLAFILICASLSACGGGQTTETTAVAQVTTTAAVEATVAETTVLETAEATVTETEKSTTSEENEQKELEFPFEGEWVNESDDTMTLILNEDGTGTFTAIKTTTITSGNSSSSTSTSSSKSFKWEVNGSTFIMHEGAGEYEFEMVEESGDYKLVGEKITYVKTAGADSTASEEENTEEKDDDGILAYENEAMSAVFDKAELRTDLDGKNIVFVYWTFTNKTDDIARALDYCEMSIFQNGSELSRGITTWSAEDTQNFSAHSEFTEVLGGESIQIITYIEIPDASAPITCILKGRDIHDHEHFMKALDQQEVELN